MMNTTEKPKRKRIQRKFCIAEVAVQEVFTPRDPAGFILAERKFLNSVGILVSNRYRELYGKAPEVVSRLENWRFAPNGKVQLVQKTLKVAVYPLSFKQEMVEVMKANLPDEIGAKQRK